jgi:hypothetical protein
MRQKMCGLCRESHDRATGKEQEFYRVEKSSDGLVHSLSRLSYRSCAVTKLVWVIGRENTLVSCLDCLTDKHTWSLLARRCPLEPKLWIPRPVYTKGHHKIIPRHDLQEGAFALQDDGTWLPWDYRTPAWAISGKYLPRTDRHGYTHGGAPMNIYGKCNYNTCNSGSRGDCPSRLGSTFTCDLNGCSNGDYGQRADA